MARKGNRIYTSCSESERTCNSRSTDPADHDQGFGEAVAHALVMRRLHDVKTDNCCKEQRGPEVAASASVPEGEVERWHKAGDADARQRHGDPEPFCPVRRQMDRHPNLVRVVATGDHTGC